MIRDDTRKCTDAKNDSNKNFVDYDSLSESVSLTSRIQEISDESLNEINFKEAYKTQ